MKREQQMGVLRFLPRMAAGAVRTGEWIAANFTAQEVGSVRAGGVLPYFLMERFLGSQRVRMIPLVAWCYENFRKGGVIFCPAIQSAVVLPAEDGRLPRRSPERHHLFGVRC